MCGWFDSVGIKVAIFSGLYFDWMLLLLLNSFHCVVFKCFHLVFFFYYFIFIILLHCLFYLSVCGGWCVYVCLLPIPNWKKNSRKKFALGKYFLITWYHSDETWILRSGLRFFLNLSFKHYFFVVLRFFHLF